MVLAISTLKNVFPLHIETHDYDLKYPNVRANNVHETEYPKRCITT